MNKAILINFYSNTPNSLNQKFEKSNILNFDYLNSDYKTIDEYISRIIIKKIHLKELDIIYVKDNLSSNYLELYGLRVAFHIRLSQKINEKKLLPIVILSDLNAYTLNKIEPMARILFTKNIYIEPNSISTIEKYENKNINLFYEKEYKSKFLDLIEVHPPENSNNHSIANEWAIFTWAKELKILNSEDINKTISKISYQLYFKYLCQKNEIKDSILIPKEKKINKQSKKGLIFFNKTNQEEKKILIIDDELDKGWADIFVEYFKKKRNYIKPEILPIKFKNEKYEDVEEKILNYVEEYKPDLILLDMRLVPSDHYEKQNPKNISGIKLLKRIKETSLETKLNPGIQVIMLTASTRSDILEESYASKILGYIQKDHIDNSIFSTKDNIDKLSQLLKDSEKKFFLKDIWIIQHNILKLNIFKKDKYNEIKKEVGFIFEILDSDMENKLKFSMITIYKVLEIIKDLYISNDGKYLPDKNNVMKMILFKDKMYKNVSKEIVIKNPNGYGFKKTIKKTSKDNASIYYKSTTNKIRAIIYEKFFIKDKELHDFIGNISQKRNKYIHPDNGKQSVEVTKDEIEVWFKKLSIIIIKMNAIEYKDQKV